MPTSAPGGGYRSKLHHMASISDITIRRAADARAEHGFCPMCRKPVTGRDHRIRIGEGLWVHRECGTYSSRRRHERHSGHSSHARTRALRRARSLVDGARDALGDLRQRD